MREVKFLFFPLQLYFLKVHLEQYIMFILFWVGLGRGRDNDSRPFVLVLPGITVLGWYGNSLLIVTDWSTKNLVNFGNGTQIFIFILRHVS